MIDEISHAKETIKILEKKISENSDLLKEKNENISTLFSSLHNSNVSGESLDYASKMNILDNINYSKAIAGIANRQLARYFMMLNKPYFGRLDFKSNNKVSNHYFGIETIIDNEDIVIYDWRSPIANLYYDSIIGKGSYMTPNGECEGEVLLRRQYKFDKGELVFYTDAGNISDDILLDALRNSNSSIMKNIVATIQAEQNKVIRFIDDKRLLVLGVAGSGKTSIALHRIAYLMYKNQLKYNSNNVCFITPNNSFFNYIDSVLPELGEDNVKNFTLNKVTMTMLKSTLYKYQLKVELKEDYLERLINDKVDMDFDKEFNDINRFLQEKVNNNLNPIGLKLKGLTFSPLLFKELYLNKFSRRDFTTRKRFIKEYILDRLSTKGSVGVSLVKSVDIFVNKLLPDLNFYELFIEYYKDRDYIIRNSIKYEYAFIMIYMRLFLGESKLFKGYNHVFIDEYQDLNIFERECIEKLFNCSKTYLADINQKLFNQESFENEDINIVRLTNSYRSSKPIFDFYTKLIDSKGINSINREGKEVETKCFDDKEKLINKLKEEIENYKGKSFAIVTKTFKESKKLYEELKGFLNVKLLNFKENNVVANIVVGCIYAVKGLEFEKVIVYDASKNTYYSELDRNYLYIACSRAMHELSVYAIKEFSDYINE